MSKEGWSLSAGLPGAVHEGGIEWQTLPFGELDTAVLYRVLALRSAVFVVEQECLYQDMDGLDPQSQVVVGIRAWGATGFADATRFDVVATARIMPPGTGFADPSIGRMCVAQPARQHGIGRILLRQAVDVCRRTYPGRPIRISAQAHLEHFYRAGGFKVASEVYLEDHIPHVEMVLMPPKVAEKPAAD